MNSFWRWCRRGILLLVTRNDAQRVGLRPEPTPQRRSTLHVDGLPVEVVRKRMKNLRLTIVPPAGHVRVSCPLRVGDAAVRAFVTEKRAWIHEKQRLCIERARLRQPALVDGAVVHVWGERRVLCLEPIVGRGRVELEGERALRMCVPPDAAVDERQALLDRWYRQALGHVVPVLIAQWEPVVGRRVAEWRVRKMRTRWGSCNPRAARIWLGLELATRSPECLEYVLVHEMAHLLEPSHNARFYYLMDRFMPDWKVRRKALEAPVWVNLD